MIITDDLLKELEEKFPLTRYDNALTWEEACRIQGQRQIINYLRMVQKDLNAKAMDSGEHQVTVEMK